MRLGFKSNRETRYEHRKNVKRLLYTKQKDDRTFIIDSSQVKKEALETRDFCHLYGKGVKVSGVGQIYKQRPGSLPLYCQKPKASVTLHDKESAPFLQWLDFVTKQNEGQKVKHLRCLGACRHINLSWAFLSRVGLSGSG